MDRPSGYTGRSRIFDFRAVRTVADALPVTRVIGFASSADVDQFFLSCFRLFDASPPFFTEAIADPRGLLPDMLLNRLKGEGVEPHQIPYRLFWHSISGHRLLEFQSLEIVIDMDPAFANF